MSIKIRFLGRVRNLTYSVASYKAMENYLGMARLDIQRALPKHDPDPVVFGAVLWAGLIHGDKGLTPQEVSAALVLESHRKQAKIYRAVYASLQKFKFFLSSLQQSAEAIGEITSRASDALAELGAAIRSDPDYRIPSGMKR